MGDEEFDDGYTLTDRVRDLATSVACANIVLFRLAQVVGDLQSAEVAMDGVMAGIRAECGPTKAAEVALAMAAKVSGLTEERLEEMFDSGLSSKEIANLVTAKGGDNGGN
jgi:hypothetical protein